MYEPISAPNFELQQTLKFYEPIKIGLPCTDLFLFHATSILMPAVIEVHVFLAHPSNSISGGWIPEHTHRQPSYEPRCEKTGHRGFRPRPPQTRLYSHRR